MCAWFLARAPAISGLRDAFQVADRPLELVERDLGRLAVPVAPRRLAVRSCLVSSFSSSPASGRRPSPCCWTGPWARCGFPAGPRHRLRVLRRPRAPRLVVLWLFGVEVAWAPHRRHRGPRTEPQSGRPLAASAGDARGAAPWSPRAPRRRGTSEAIRTATRSCDEPCLHARTGRLRWSRRTLRTVRGGRAAPAGRAGRVRLARARAAAFCPAVVAGGRALDLGVLDRPAPLAGLGLVHHDVGLEAVKVGPHGALDVARTARELLDQRPGLNVDVDLDPGQARRELVKRRHALVAQAWTTCHLIRSSGRCSSISAWNCLETPQILALKATWVSSSWLTLVTRCMNLGHSSNWVNSL